ncbi:uncharacterized protein LOC134025471 [Osmerus eperlanus]|uniref:uncharacterized protein LOC134025471 n=1 Tax=Osmerus eperlanus TaxID=29151 RepID=UPI002E0EBB2B
MFVSMSLHRLLLTTACVCVLGSPAPPLHQQASSSENRDCAGPCVAMATTGSSTSTHGLHSEPSDGGKETTGVSEHVTTSWIDLSETVEAEGGAGSDGGEMGLEGITSVKQTRNEVSREGRSGTRRAGEEAGEEAGSRRTWAETKAATESLSKREETQTETRVERGPGPGGDIMENIPATKLTSMQEEQGMRRGMTAQGVVCESAASSTLSPKSVPPSQTESEVAGETKGPVLENSSNIFGREERRSRPSLSSLGLPLQDADMTRPSYIDHVGSSGSGQKGTPLTGSQLSRISSSLHSSLTSNPDSMWAEEEVTVPSLPDPLLPDLGTVLTSRQEGPDSLWTEPLRQIGEDTVAPLSQDVATEGTMSSEDLPLIFEPFDDVTPEGALPSATPIPGDSQTPAAMATGGMMLSEAELDLLVTVDADSDGPSHAPSLLIPDWTSPWQISGAEISEPISPSVGGDTPRDLGDTLPTSGPSSSSSSSSSIQTPVATVTTATDHPTAPKLRSGLEELESEEEPDEDEEDDNAEESEEESQEELVECSIPAPTRPPFNLIPPPPVWVQRNQGLMRSWVELIREKAGYVSGMLAPVGIGIAGALLIVGALYSIRMIHRKRRNSFKHQRRKARQTEQPLEPGSSRQDQAMLLADSSEDEF